MFFPPAFADGFYKSLSGNESSQVSRILLSILTDLNNVVVFMLSTCPAISKYSIALTLPRALITIGIIVTFMFHCFF